MNLYSTCITPEFHQQALHSQQNPSRRLLGVVRVHYRVHQVQMGHRVPLSVAQ